MTYEKTQNPASRIRRLRSFMREALSDNNIDFTNIPVGRAVGLLALPMMLEMAMESIFAVVDIAYVSRLGAGAIAVVGITEAMLSILYAVAVGLGMGVTAMVSRRIGEKKPDAAAHTAMQAIWLGGGLAVVIGVFGAVYAADLLRLMGAEPAVIDIGSGYATVLYGGSASILLLFLLNAAFRGAGDATIALRSLWLANGINIVLDPCLIFGLGPFPELGITGAAIATTIGRSIGVLYQLYYLVNGRSRLTVRFKHLRPNLSIMKRLIVVSTGGILQFLIGTSSWIFMMRIVATYGSAPVAAYTIAIRMLEFVFLPAWGLGNAAATLVGQNLGANQPERAEQSAWMAARFNTIFMSGTAVFVFVLAPQIIQLFSDEPEVLRYGVSCLRIIGIGFTTFAAGMIVLQSLNGAGDTRTPTIMNFYCFWLLEIPLAYWLAKSVGMGPNGVFTAIVIAETVLSVWGIVVFRRGHWKLQHV